MRRCGKTLRLKKLLMSLISVCVTVNMLQRLTHPSATKFIILSDMIRQATINSCSWLDHQYQWLLCLLSALTTQTSSVSHLFTPHNRSSAHSDRPWGARLKSCVKKKCSPECTWGPLLIGLSNLKQPVMIWLRPCNLRRDLSNCQASSLSFYYLLSN